MKGILFKPWKIAAIAANPDKEWQTRRMSGLKEINKEPDAFTIFDTMKDGTVLFDQPSGDIIPAKPRYHVGEVVYIKEAWAIDKELNDYSWNALPDDEGPYDVWLNSGGDHKAADSSRGRWRSPMFMPQRAARYFIQITQVEVCRTKDITPEDCKAEGIIPLHLPHITLGSVKAYSWEVYPTPNIFDSPRLAYFALYDSINGKGAHEKNWDWRYEFKPVPKPLEVTEEQGK